MTVILVSYLLLSFSLGAVWAAANLWAARRRDKAIAAAAKQLQIVLAEAEEIASNGQVARKAQKASFTAPDEEVLRCRRANRHRGRGKRPTF